MKKEVIFFIFVLAVTVLSFYLLYQILSPFLESILWAILMAMVFYPLYRRLQNLLRRREILSALAMTVLVVLVIMMPFSLLVVSLANEVINAYQSVQEMIQSGRFHLYFEEVQKAPFLHWIWTLADEKFHLSEMKPLELLLKNLQQISTFLFNQSSKILKGLSTFLIGFFFTLLSLYYFFKDGSRLFERLKEIAPVPSKESNLLIRRFQEMVHATIYGGILIALIQGLIGGMAFWVLGLNSPILWGTAMAFFSFIPIGGTALIWGPTCLLLFVTGAFAKGIILLAVGVLGISMVDNILRPSFISSRTHIHPLLLFFAVLGGIQAFGLIGLFIGPLVATLCLTLMEISL